MEIGRGLNAIAGLERVCHLAAVAALADLHVPVRIHAFPVFPSQSAPRLGKCREAFLDRPRSAQSPEQWTTKEGRRWEAG
jgi:hypothetical protein